MSTPSWRGARDQESPRFVRAVAEGLRSRLPREWGDFTFTARYRLGQVSYGMKGLHYEVWLHEATGHLEIGFHMEADRVTNAALYDLLEDHLPLLKAHLGLSIELERWDKGWCRLYRTMPLGGLSADLLEETCRYLASLIALVQPLCVEWVAEHAHLSLQVHASVPRSARP